MLIWRSGSQRSLGRLLENWFGRSAKSSETIEAKTRPTASASPPPLTSRATAERKPG